MERQGQRSRLRHSFEVEKAFPDRYEVHQVGGQTILQYWIPAEDLDSFNAHIVGPIEDVAEYPERTIRGRRSAFTAVALGVSADSAKGLALGSRRQVPCLGQTR